MFTTGFRYMAGPFSTAAVIKANRNAIRFRAVAHFKCPKHIEFEALPKTSTEERISCELKPAPTGIEQRSVIAQR